MRRAKLAPGSAPSGSLSTASCYTVPRCFVCDEPIKSHRLSTSLLSGRTQYTHSPLPTKIGGYIGDEFVVVVTPQDALCKHCMALINTMDRLELELRQHRYTLTQHLKTKYKLDGHAAKGTNNKYEVGDDEEDLEEPEIIEVSDEEWTPNKKQRTDSGKQHRCTICNASYTNLSLFMAHLSRHKQMVKSKATAVSLLPPVKSSIINSPHENCVQGLKFKCGCCSEYFATKESLALHMQLHTGPQIKSKACYVLPTNVGKSTIETFSSVVHVKPEPIVQASALFEDIEQLSHQEVSASEGVCSEEQKGRVCLLALLNNGVCSDLSHRTPADGLVHHLPENSVINSIPKVSHSSGGETISITVSIPNVINGGQMTEQQISLPAISEHSNSTSLSYPVTLTNSVVTSTLGINSLPVICTLNNKHQENNSGLSCQNFNLSQASDMQNNCLDMPDLLNEPFHGMTKLSSQLHQNSHELSIRDDNRQQMPPKWNSGNPVENLNDIAIHVPMTSSELVQGMDMPSLLDEDMITSRESFVLRPGNVDAAASGNAAVHLNGAPLCSELGENSSVLKEVNCHTQLDSSLLESPNKCLLNSVENIAIVSVTSVQMNRDNFDADNVVTDWLYSSSSKEISPVLEGQKTSELDSGVEASWFNENDHLSVSDKQQSDKFNTSEYAISADSSIASQNMASEGGKAADEQEKLNKISSFV